MLKVPHAIYFRRDVTMRDVQADWTYVMVPLTKADSCVSPPVRKTALPEKQMFLHAGRYKATPTRK